MKYCPECGELLSQEPGFFYQHHPGSIIHDSRGIPVEKITHNIKYDCPNDHKWIEMIDPYGGPDLIKRG